METAFRRTVWSAVAALAVLLLIVLNSAGFLTDYAWFRSLNFASVFWVSIRWVWALRATVFVVAFVIFWVNLRWVRPQIAKAMFRFQEALPEGLSWRVVRWFFLLGSLVLAFMFAAGIGGYWQSVALFFHGAASGQTDPVFGRDISFYLFQLPVYNLARTTLTSLVVLTLLICGGIYVLVGAVHLDGLRVRIQPAARRHLAVLAAIVFALKAWGYLLDAYDLLYGAHGVVYGIGYTQAHLLLPTLRVLMVVAALAALGALLNVVIDRSGVVIAGIVALVGVSVLMGNVAAPLLQQFVVQPNELSVQTPYIARQVKSTLAAYGLDHVDEQFFGAPQPLTQAALADNRVTLQNARLWDWRPLLRTYNQLQTFKRYYTFTDVDVDRYSINGHESQVELAARELTPEGIPNPSWVNLHLQYTHGYGAAVSPVNEVTGEGLPDFYLSNIPPETNQAVFKLDRSQIYYGEGQSDYAIVDTSMQEFDHPSGEANVRTTYQGTGGVPIGSLWSRLLFSLRFGTINILLNGNIDGNSRVMFYRNITDRVQRIAPFLRYDHDPYLVIANNKLYWMLDAYTTSNNYPYSRPYGDWGNYVRNSVKVVIDAYNGTVSFYVADPSDPVIAAYQGVYPGLFQPLAQMPAALRDHIRYPEDLFAVQSRIYAVYHMTDPTVFYNQEDLWNVPSEIASTGSQNVAVQPYYIVMRLPQGQTEEMLLMLPFTPANKDNMIAWLAARMDGAHYGQLVLFRFPKDSLTYGPAQIEARINQNATISQLLTLWSQHGSQVVRGNLLVIPIDHSVLYVEPLYLRSEQSDLPELKRVIVAADGNIGLGVNLSDALSDLFGTDGGSALMGPATSGSNQATTPTAPGTNGATDRTVGWQQLADRAAAEYDAAQQAIKAGDFAAYGDAIKRLGATIQQLKAASGQAMTPVPNAVPSSGA